MSHREVKKDDPAGISIWIASTHGKLLGLWNGFAWVVLDGKQLPETWPMSHVWVSAADTPSLPKEVTPISNPTDDGPGSGELKTVGQAQDFLARYDRAVPLYPYNGRDHDPGELEFSISPLDYQRDGVDLPNGLMVSIT